MRGSSSILSGSSQSNNPRVAPSLHDPTLEYLRHVNCHLLRQAICLLELAVVDDEIYCRRSKAIDGSSIGKHLRHAHDHLRILLESGKGSSINYDARERDIPMENSREAALNVFKSTLRRLIANDPPLPSSQAEVIVEAQTPYAVETVSSFGRELWFAAHHCIHHYAMIRVIVNENEGFPVDWARIGQGAGQTSEWSDQDESLGGEFGVAPSTSIARGFKEPQNASPTKARL